MLTAFENYDKKKNVGIFSEYIRSLTFWQYFNVEKYN